MSPGYCVRRSSHTRTAFNNTADMFRSLVMVTKHYQCRIKLEIKMVGYWLLLNKSHSLLQAFLVQIGVNVIVLIYQLLVAFVLDNDTHNLHNAKLPRQMHADPKASYMPQLTHKHIRMNHVPCDAMKWILFLGW